MTVYQEFSKKYWVDVFAYLADHDQNYAMNVMLQPGTDFATERHPSRTLSPYFLR